MTTSSALRVGVVGCGQVAANHAKAYRDAAGVELVACLDVDDSRAALFAAEHGIRHSGSDPAAFFAAQLDAVSICTPHPTHEEMVTAAADHGVHVLCEKPLAVTAEAASRMVKACTNNNVRLGVVFQRRWWHAARRIRDAIDDGSIGEPFLGRVEVLLHRDSSYYSATPWRGTWDADGGGVLMTQAIHYLDLLQWYMGDVESVWATAGTFRHAEHIEVEDTLTATLRFASGAIGQLVASTALSPGLGQHVSVTGTNGATVGLLEYPEGHEARNHVWTTDGENFVSPMTQLHPSMGLSEINAQLAPFHALQIADFITALREDREPLVTGHDALRSLSTLTAIYASLRSGQPEHPATTLTSTESS